NGLELQINSLGCRDCRASYREKLKKFLEDKSSDLCIDCRRRICTNPLRTFDCKNKVCQEITSLAPKVLEYICPNCAENFEDVKRNLEQLGVSYRINPQLVRGLDYYTRTTFEVVTDKLGAQNAVAAGGRYDGLIQELGGPDIPGLGFAIGMERLIPLIPKEKCFSAPLYLFIAPIGNAAKDRALQLANRFRIMGIKTEIGYEGKSLKSQMRWANKLNTKFVMIIGDEELASGRVIFRDMESQKQEEVEIEKIIEEVKSRKRNNLK
ncbi:MAG: histidine--tRNA ligase, partial [Desulfobacteria bacterium]